MSTPLEVLHVHSGNLFGGVETFLLTLAKYPEPTPDVTHRFSLCYAGSLRERLIGLGTKPLDLGIVRSSLPWTVIRGRRRLRSIIRHEHPSVVVCHAPWAQAIFGPTVRAEKCPLVYWQHGTTTGRNWVERWARLTRPDIAITNSLFTAATVSSIYPETRCEVIRYPVEPPEAAWRRGRGEIRREIGTSPDAAVIIQVSRMEPWKGHRLHLEALGSLRDVPNWVCWQVGGAQRPEEERYLADLHALADSLGITNRIRFLGQRSDVPDLLGAADIFCQPNVGPEPFGITFVEALYAGLPVVTAAMGGAMEIVDESCGVLSPPEDVSALTVSLRELIEDGERRARLANAAPARAKDICDPSVQMLQLYDVLEETLKCFHR